MKKMILMVVLVLPLALSAQKTKPATRGVENTKMGEMTVPMVYGEIVVTDQQNRDNVKVRFDDATMRLVQGKVQKMEMDQIERFRFNSTLQAINYLSALGWTIGDSYSMERRTGSELHIIISQPSPKMLKPDLAGERTTPSKETGKK